MINNDKLGFSKRIIKLINSGQDGWRKRLKKAQIINVRNIKGNITIHFTDIKKDHVLMFFKQIYLKI